MRVLPFDDDAFTWTRFESFCLAVVRALPEVKRAERYGKTGEKQRGIDIAAELHDGRKRTIQCRLRKRFTKANAEKTVADTTYVADEHEIWVTCDVGTAVSDYVDGLAEWSLRSGEGISQTVRELPRETARRIVEDAFGPAVRRAFLGPNGPIAFESPEAYFAPLDAPERLLRHDLELVGRDDELRTLNAAAGDGAVRFVVQPGRGGIGKTRLLRAAAEALPGRNLFARDGAELTAAAVDDLPFEPVTVFVDDAHHADVSLGPLLAAALRRKEPLTIVAAVRPGAVDAVRAAAMDAGLDAAQVAVLPELDGLPEPAVDQLSAAALGESSAASERLAAATRETPMITVIGGRLLARGALAGAGAQASDAELREAVLARFSSELLGRITPKVPAVVARELSTLVAALQPLNVADDRLMELLAADLEVARSKVRRWLGELESSGLLLARGDLRRLAPDVLADQLLLEACLDGSGAPTGYAEELWERFGSDAARTLLRNLAEVDWRVGGEESSLLDPIWDKIERAFVASSAFGREELIRTIARAAYAIPQRVLRLVRLALDQPARPTEWPLTDVSIDDASVRGELPQLLRAAGAHPAHAAEAMALLWKLARDDDRPTNSYPNHPLRVLADLGGYDHTAAHHDALLDVIEREAVRPGVDDHANSPLPLVRALLAREGTRSHGRGLRWQLGSYTVSAAATQRWRRRIRNLLVDRTLRGSTRQQLVAAQLFDDALRLPHGYFGRAPASEIVDSWRDDQAELLDAIETIGESTDQAAVRQALAAALRWHAEHGPWPEVEERARALRSHLMGPDEELVAALAAPWGILDRDAKRERDERVAQRLLDAHPDPDDLARVLDDLVRDIASRGQNAIPDHVLGAVFDRSAEHARGFCAWALEHAERPLAFGYGVALDRLRRSVGDVDELIRRGWASGAPALRRSVAGYLSGGAWFDDPREAELEVLEESVRDTDPIVANLTATTTLLRLQETDPHRAMRLALEVEFDVRNPDADATFAIFKDGGIDSLEAPEVDRLAERLAGVPELGYFASELLGDLGRSRPDLLVSVWVRRLRNDSDGFEAVPFHDFGVDMLPADRQQRVSTLGSILGHANEARGWSLREIGRLIWRLAVPGLDEDASDPEEQLAARAEVIDDALAELGSWIVAAEEDDVVTELLFEFPWLVLLERPDWVHTVLEESPGTRRAAVESGLHAAAFGGGHGRTLGEDSPRLTRTAEAARAAADGLPAGSAAARLFSDIARIARKEIEQERRRDDELDAGWE
jgi:hypothetical protein